MDSQIGQTDLNPWVVEYLDSQDDEPGGRESYVPVYDPVTEDPSEISARMEPYFCDPDAVQTNEDGWVYVLETRRHKLQIFERV